MTTMRNQAVVSHADAMDEIPDPEVPERAKRPRSYSARYKAEILVEYETLDRDGKGRCCAARACTPRCCRSGASSATRARWRRSLPHAAAHRSTRWRARTSGCSGRTPGCASSWSRPAR